MRVKIILNPQADNGRAKDQMSHLRALQSKYNDLEVILTEYPGHAEELARAAAANGFDLVVAAGGDGTVHEVVNGLVQDDRAAARLGIIPIGSGNDLAYALGISTNVETAVSQLFTGKPHPIDLVRIEDENGRVSLADNNLGIGFDATVVIRTQQMTRIHGFWMYLLATLHTIAFYYQTPYLELQFDQEPINQKVLFLAVGVGHRSGGGFFLTPEARHDDNQIDTCLVNPISRFTMLGTLIKAMKGTHVTEPFVTMRKNQYITVKSDSPLPIHVDGEMFAYPKDNVRQVTMYSLPAAIEVIA
jgi:diacylglycerol kinase (ATP)